MSELCIISFRGTAGGSSTWAWLAELVKFARGDDRLRAWRDTEYPRLAAAFAPRVTVPLSVWQKRWPPGIDASWDAFSQLLGLNRGLGAR
jgi:hypothetical protein